MTEKILADNIPTITPINIFTPNPNISLSGAQSNSNVGLHGEKYQRSTTAIII